MLVRRVAHLLSKTSQRDTHRRDASSWRFDQFAQVRIQLLD
jgi:hypothetical protein